ncbi:MAG: DUF6159 family protein [Candidatus Pacebacteria bacterium]|jgi:hypothetical protein|nr:DUF6159 family protein [Candidatus Paceibacterota bacterium]
MRLRGIQLGDQKISRFKASWLLLKESWRFLRADSELLFVPVIATIIMVLLFAVLIIGLLVSGFVTAAPGDAWTTQGLIFIAGSYLITAFVVALSQAMVTHTVFVRSKGNNATLGQSFSVAVRHIPSLFMWSIISATVGVALRAISERSQWLGWIATSFLGAAWGVVTYFVVPAIVVTKKSAFGALTHSGSVFKQTWGETLITNISLGLIFLVLHGVAILVFLGCFFLSVETGVPAIFVVSGIVYVVWLFAAIALQQVLNSIIITLLYVYATSDTLPANFDAELLEAIVARTKPAHISPITPPPPVSL